MNISTKGRYGLRALLDLAVNSSTGQVPLALIAEREHISFNYLEQVFALLRKGGIVKSVKGPQGGYVLAKPSNKINIKDVIFVLEGELKISEDEEKLNDSQKVIDNLLWKKINESINEILSDTTLQDLVNEYNKLNKAEINMYYI